MSRRLNPLDTSWLMLESADTPMHVGLLMVFELPPGAGTGYVAKLSAQLREAAPAGPPWTLKLSRGPLLARRWETEDAPDLEYHFRENALPEPGGERELGILVERLHSRALDLSRPPWEVHLISNLHDRRFALYCKLHQSLMDTSSMVELLTGALATAPGAAPHAFWAQVALESARSRSTDAAAAALRGLSRDSLGALRALGGAFGRLFRGDGGLRAPYTAPRSALNARIDNQRRCATQQYDLDRLERLAAACDATVEEMALFLCGSVLRRFFKEHNALPDESLVAMQLRPATELGDTSLGFIALGTGHADPRRRLDEVRASVQAARDHLDALPPDLVPAYSVTTALPYLLGQVAGLSGFIPAMFNLIVAGLRGPDEKRWLGEARLAAIYPMLPLTQNGALAIGALRYAGTLNVGICGARETLPRLQRMAVYMGQALEDLEARVAAGESS